MEVEMSIFVRQKLTSIFPLFHVNSNNKSPQIDLIYSEIPEIKTMLRQTVNCVRHRIVPQVRSRSTKVEPKVNTDANQWDLLVGVQIERLPVISKTLSKLEREYQVYPKSAVKLLV